MLNYELLCTPIESGGVIYYFTLVQIDILHAAINILNNYVVSFWEALVVYSKTLCIANYRHIEHNGY